MFTPKMAFPICTIANTPRLPEHCIEWASVLQWPKIHPRMHCLCVPLCRCLLGVTHHTLFFADTKLDHDSPQHVQWLYETASARAEEFKIKGVTYALTQGVVKNIIPAIAATNAIVAGVSGCGLCSVIYTRKRLLHTFSIASCCNEAFKMVTSSAHMLKTYMVGVLVWQ